MKTILTILLLSVTTLTYTQNIKSELLSDELTEKTQTFFKTFFDQIQSQNWEELLDNMPKGFLDIMSKDALIDQMEKAFNNEAFTTSFNEMTFKNIESVFSFESVKYANVNYFNSFTFHFIQSETQTDDDFNVYLDFMVGTFKNQFKDQIITRKGKDITISGDKVILIIDDPKVGQLKMLEFDKNMAELYKMFMPESVVNNLLSN